MTKQEELSNEEGAGKETSEQKEFEEKLQEIANLDNPKPASVKKEKRPGILTRLGKVARPVVLAMGAVIAAGAGCAPEQKDFQQKTAETTAEKIDPQEQKTFEENEEFLVKTFKSISGGEVGRAESGNLIVFVGGNYYELDSSAMNSLSKIVQRYRVSLEGKTKFDKDFRLKKIEASRMAIEAKVIELGQKVNISKLPQNLKELESAREQIREEMNDSGQLKVKQESGSKKVKSQKTTSSEAGEFLN